MIHKHEIPILEFDDSPQAVIIPIHEDLDLDLPARGIYAFLEEEIERYANAVEADKVGEFVSATKSYPIFVMSYNWEEICLVQAPVGSAAAVQFLDWLKCECSHVSRRDLYSSKPNRPDLSGYQCCFFQQKSR